MRAILALPVLGLVSRPSWPSLYVRSHFDWDDATATVAPMSCDVRYFSAFTPGMPSQVLSQVADGAFWLTDMKWTIEWPGEPLA
jgi:hypothetical protein